MVRVSRLELRHSETGKDTSVRAACHDQTQSAMTATESLWALYSDGRRPERWWVHSLTDHLPFSFQARLFVTGNKQGAVRALKFREDWVKEAATFLPWAVSSSQG